ncbi:type II toxin-antitoxin system PemK/MazF family toxin [Nocardioides cavernaquae]|uniref:Type II toxin-antitoxin system PemK/MazF family toxin n=1 Tax=Nocardioides cavernaquae TaxID=2321396 RepID=A0A3A5H655_9ACTN|nr:type II toxin-antitoxin system PemK/MazF family toxin [Nocardioides cavernaquae]RJS45348.1 type II toxin-antitoxin system PemK/MazF family toxin [Nocardioides cavernaquae]
MEPTYAPQADGSPDPGEVVWAWVPFEEDASRGKDRPVVLLALEGDTWFALPMTSKDHDRDVAQEAGEGRFWMDVGSGAWDSRGRPSEVRLDRLLRLDAASVRREGSALPQQVFEAVVSAARPYLPAES